VASIHHKGETGAGYSVWARFHRRLMRLRVVALTTGILTFVLFVYAWWRSLDPHRDFPASPGDWVVFVTMILTALAAIITLWITSGRGREELTLYLEELQSHLGGSITLHPHGIRRRLHRLRVEVDLTGRSPWWENIDTVYSGTWKQDRIRFEVSVHDPRFGWPYLEGRLKIPRAGFPVMWLWFDPPFKIGFEIDGVYVDSREGTYRIRPYLDLLYRWHVEYGLKNIRFEDGVLELRFVRLKIAPPQMRDLLQRLNELPT